MSDKEYAEILKNLLVPIHAEPAMDRAIELLEQEPLCDRLAREYISKVKYCDECFASTFCTINGLRNSRVPQSYCIGNIKKYFESKSEGKE